MSIPTTIGEIAAAAVRIEEKNKRARKERADKFISGLSSPAVHFLGVPAEEFTRDQLIKLLGRAMAVTRDISA